jgi:hypothetical protein
MRHYYENRLSAAWMADNHQFTFLTPKKERLYYDGGGNFRKHRDCVIYTINKFILDDDTLPLLEPILGDIAMIDRWHWARQRGECDYEEQLIPVSVIAMGKDKEWIGFSHPGHGYDNWRRDKDRPVVKYTIIQRDGKPFHWPKHETS